MNQRAAKRTRRWTAFPIPWKNFADQIEFQDDGTVRLGERAFAEGSGVEYRFAGNKAHRPSAFGAVLEIETPDHQMLYFRYEGEQWYRIVEVTNDRPWFYGFRKEVGHSGLMVGTPLWAVERIGDAISMFFSVLFPLLLLFVFLCTDGAVRLFTGVFLVSAVYHGASWWRERIYKQRAESFEWDPSDNVPAAPPSDGVDTLKRTASWARRLWRSAMSWLDQKFFYD